MSKQYLEQYNLLRKYVEERDDNRISMSTLQGLRKELRHHLDNFDNGYAVYHFMRGYDTFISHIRSLQSRPPAELTKEDQEILNYINFINDNDLNFIVAEIPGSFW